MTNSVILECFMKKIYYLLLFFLIFSIILSSFSAYAEQRVNSLLIIGDSISSGYGLEGYPDSVDLKNYGNILAEKSGLKNGENYFNLSLDGETTSGLLWRIKNSDKGAFSGFDTVIISSGGNDLIDSLLPSVIALATELTGKSYSDMGIIPKLTLAAEKVTESTKTVSQQIMKNLDAVLKELKKKNPNAFIGLLGIYNPFEDSSNPFPLNLLNRSIIRPCIDLINNAIKSVAEENGVCYIDLSESFNGRARELTNIKNYDIHPNHEGHALISEIIFDKTSR